ncbi:MAG TPA: PAS domain S-box protein [Dehalococcoidia bacterium]|jgi:PAS domain S-box-containing protein
MNDKHTKVLLIEDNPGDVRLIREMLAEVKGVSYNLVSAGRLSAGLEYLTKQRFDVILLDLGLPDSQGLETLDKIFAKTPTIPIVVLTGLDDEATANEAVHKGAQDYLLKGDINSRALSRVIRYAVERKQAEKTLRESEGKYRALFEFSPDGILIADVDTKGFLYANPAICKMLGYDAEELTGMAVSDIHPKDKLKHVIAEFEMQASGRKRLALDIPLLRKDGSILYADVNTAKILLTGRECLVGFFRDITERKKAEKALKESEGKYRLLAENASDIIWTTDMNLGFTYISPSVERVRGYTVEEAINQSLEEIFTPSSAETAVNAFTEELATESLETKDLSRVRMLELELSCKDGSKVWCEVMASFIRDNDGHPVGILGAAREITERRKAEEALRQSEERYRTILEDMEESYYETDLAGNFTLVNDALCRHLGYSKEEMIGMNYLVFTPPEDVKRVSQSSAQVYRTGEPVKWFPREMIRKDGSRTFHETSIFPLRNESGEIIGWRGVGRDVTERKKAEEILRESEDRYRDLVDHSNDLICTHDLDGRILSANPLALRVLGYGLDSMLQKNVRDFLLPEFREGFDAYLAEIQKQGAVEGLLTVQTATGERRIWEFNNTLRIEGVAAPVVRGMARDITERKQAEEALRRSEERYRTILEDMEDSYFEVDLTGNLTFVNDSTCRNLGYSREELIGMDYRKFTAEEDIEPVYQIFNDVFQTGKPHKGYYWNFVRKDGRVGFADASVSVLRDREGKIIGFRGVGRDMTDRKKAEQQLLTSAKLASVGELAAGVAHEINNPLTAVLGYAQLLASRQDIPQDIKHDLDVICQESQRTVKIVQNLLRFARQHKPDRILTDINELIERTLELQLYKLTTSNIKLTTRLAEGCLWVVVDYNQIQQVILNIVINAMQALAEVKHKGKITVTTGIDKDQVIISVADNGPGIDKENITKVFDPFFSTKAVGSGSGLGLSVCHGIIAEHDGNIYVESTKGEGATFIIELPSAPEDAAVVKEKIAIKKKRPRRRRKVEKSILIVEDEPAICDVLVRVLSEDGHRVDIASSGKEALRKLKKKVYNLFIVDLKMPEMSGRQLYKIMQDKHPNTADRVVFITGDTVTPETQNFLTSTGRPYLRKPFDYKELIKMAEEILRETLSR